MRRCASIAQQTKALSLIMTSGPLQLGGLQSVEHAGTCPTDHVISTIPGVVGESFKYDTLHVLEEGLTAHVLANVLFDLVVKACQEHRMRD